MLGSGVSICFGTWHLFVPGLWNWYAYIDTQATELVTAVRAINLFFSLALMLFGIVNILFVFGGKSNQYSISVMLAATSLLWLTRAFLQVIYPQGSLIPGLQVGMLAMFIIASLCFVIPLLMTLFKIPVSYR